MVVPELQENFLIDPANDDKAKPLTGGSSWGHPVETQIGSSVKLQTPFSQKPRTSPTQNYNTILSILLEKELKYCHEANIGI